MNICSDAIFIGDTRIKSFRFRFHYYFWTTTFASSKQTSFCITVLKLFCLEMSRIIKLWDFSAFVVGSQYHPAGIIHLHQLFSAWKIGPAVLTRNRYPFKFIFTHFLRLLCINGSFLYFDPEILSKKSVLDVLFCPI